LQQGHLRQRFGAHLLPIHQQPGAAHGQHVFGHQPGGLGARPLLQLLGRARPDGGVYARVGEQKGARAGFKVHQQVGLLGGQPVQARYQPAGGKGGHGGQGQAVALPASAHQFHGVALQRVQALAHVAGVVGPGGGQHHAVLGAAEQGHTQKLFQRRHLARHGALRQVQFLRGTGKALVAGSSLKAVQGLGGWQFASHGGRTLAHHSIQILISGSEKFACRLGTRGLASHHPSFIRETNA